MLKLKSLNSQPLELQSGEHPKSAILRYIAQTINDPSAVKVSIDKMDYDHSYRQRENKNIYVAVVFCTINSDVCIVKSSEYLTKKDAEKDAFDQIYKIIIDTIKKRSSNTPKNKSFNFANLTNFKRKP